MPAQYCYIVAKFVFLEHLRGSEHRQASLDGAAGARRAVVERAAFAGPADGSDARQQRLDCLDQCLGQLAADDRALILEYYRGVQRAKIEQRRELAARLGVTANALSIRAWRIRDKLETCVKACSAGR